MEKPVSNNQALNDNSVTAIEESEETVSRFKEIQTLVFEKTFHRIKSTIQKIINTRKAKKTTANGFLMLKGKLYKRAMVEFQNAMELSEAYTLDRLENEFKGLILQSDAEATLSIGLVLLQKRNKDYKLANALGNAARKMQDYKQANNLYRKALRIRKSFGLAFYNLAASLGKIEKYDYDIKGIIDKYIRADEFILPEYQNNPKILTETSTQIENRKQQDKDQQIDRIQKTITEKQTAGEKHEVERLNNTLTKLEKLPVKPTYEEIFDALKQMIQESARHQSTPAEKETYSGNIFNLGLFAYNNKDSKTALSCFTDTKAQKFRLDYTNMLLALLEYLNGDIKKATDGMFDLISKDRYNRYLNVNMGLLYKRAGNRLLACKFLIIGASLLERSEGLYRIPDIIEYGDKKLSEGKNNKALILYHIVTSEVDSEECWMKIGSIQTEAEKPAEAIKAYHEILKFNSDYKPANEKLREIHDAYCERAEEVFQIRKFSLSAAFYEKALIAVRHPETLERALAVYRQLKRNIKIIELSQEIAEINEKEKEVEQEKLRQEFVSKGKVYMKRKAFDMAISSYEKAFRMKVDKDVFVALAYMYKGLKRTEELQSLMERWGKLNKYEEEIKRKQKEKKREIELEEERQKEADKMV